MRQLSPFDQLFVHLQQGMDAVHRGRQGTTRTAPANAHANTLSDQERKHAAGLMRVNHAGEIAAQALYNGQAISARDPKVKKRLEQSALEESDHLAWCKHRVEALGERTSLFGPFWYWGSFSIGALAGAAGDKWSLGFIKETEDQVVDHLKGHLGDLPESDEESRAIVKQMIEDEQHHGDMAKRMGGAELPGIVKSLMRLTAKVMTTTSYRI